MNTPMLSATWSPVAATAAHPDPDATLVNGRRIPDSPPAYPAPVYIPSDPRSEFGVLPQAPPPYSPEPHTDSQEKEPDTFARTIFWLGFIMPLFWIMGICLLFSRLRVPEERELEKTVEERDKLLRQFRAAEVRWARRCLYALSILLVTAVLLSLIVKYSML